MNQERDKVGMAAVGSVWVGLHPLVRSRWGYRSMLAKGRKRWMGGERPRAEGFSG